MRKAFKLFAFIAFIFVLFLVVASLAFYRLMQAGEFREYLISEVERKTDLKIQLGEADLELGRILGITFRDVAISEPQSAQETISAASVTARVALLPLLQRKLIFYEIRLHKPVAQIIRDKDGRVPLLDRLLNLHFLKESDGQFAFDLRTIKITEGEIDARDPFADSYPPVTRLRGIDLELERLRGQALRRFFEKRVGPRTDQPEGAGLDFKLQATVEQGGEQTGLWAKGTLILPGSFLEFDKAWWSVETWTRDMPGSMMHANLANHLPVKSLNGKLDSHLWWEGNARQHVQVKGEVAFKGLGVDAPTIFSAPLHPGDSRLNMEVNWQPGQWELSRVEWRSKDLKLALQGMVRHGANDDTHLQLSLTMPSVPVVVIKKYLPKPWLVATKSESLVAAIYEGELQLNKAGVNASLSHMRRMVENGLDERLWIDAEFRHISAQYPGDFLPLRGFQGRMILEKGLLSFKDLKGNYGQSRLSNIEGYYRLSAAGRGILQLSASGEADLAELREQGKLGMMSAQVTKGASLIEDIGGKGKFDIVVARGSDGAPGVEGKILLDGARLGVEGLVLNEIRGQLALTRSEIKTDKVRALVAGSPIQLRLAVKDYASEIGTFDLAVESTGVKAGIVTRLLLDSGSPQDPGIVRGAIRYQGTFAKKDGRKLTGTLDLANVQLTTPPLRQPLKDLNGRIRIDETGIDFQNVKGLLAGFPAGFSGRWRYERRPQLHFDFTAPNLDITYLLSQIESESSDFYANLQAMGRVALAKGKFRGLEFADFKTELTIDRRVWRLRNPSLRAAGGLIQGEATIADKPKTTGYSVEPKIQGLPVESLLKWFEISNTEMAGKVSMTGRLETEGKDSAEKKRNLNGAFYLKIEDGTINRLRLLVQILNLLDLSRWFTLQMPDLNKQGIRFRSITGDFKVTSGVYTTQNLLVDSDDLRMSGSGKIDVPKDEIDFVLAVRPFAGVDTAINYIPLIGRGIAAIKNSFLVASFKISGSLDEPTITPAPLSTLSEVVFGILGIPKKMIGLGDDENKEEVQKGKTKESIPSKTPAPAK